MRPLDLAGWALWLGGIVFDGTIGWILLGGCAVAWIADGILHARHRA